MRHAIQVNPGLNIIFQFSLQVATNVTFEQTQTIMGRAGSVCLLNNQLSTFVETLKSTRRIVNAKSSPISANTAPSTVASPAMLVASLCCFRYRRPRCRPKFSRMSELTKKAAATARAK